MDTDLRENLTGSGSACAIYRTSKRSRGSQVESCVEIKYLVGNNVDQVRLVMLSLFVPRVYSDAVRRQEVHFLVAGCASSCIIYMRTYSRNVRVVSVCVCVCVCVCVPWTGVGGTEIPDITTGGRVQVTGHLRHEYAPNSSGAC